MWVDKDGYAHVEDQYDPDTFAEANADRVDWEATEAYRRKQEVLDYGDIQGRRAD